MTYDTPASQESLDKTVNSLTEKGYNVIVVENGGEALEKIKTLIPEGNSVMNGSSITLEKIGYADFIKSPECKWNNLNAKVNAEKDPDKRRVLRKESFVSDFYLGSVHAIATNGEFIIASNTGSQLPNIVFTSPNLIFVIGTQKIVSSLEEAIKRLEEYVRPLEDEHMKSLYGMGTNISKILIFKDEAKMIGRKINIILVKEKLGF